MTPHTRKFVVPLLWVNGSVLLAVLIMTAGNPALGWRELPRIGFYCLAFANVTAIAGLPLIFVAERFRKRKVLLFGAITGGCALLAAIGSLMARVLFVVLGIFRWEKLWQHYFSSLPLVLLMAPLVGVASTLVGRLRDRVRETEQKLHEKEIDEERSRKLAAEARLRSLESRLHPHFLFNTLNSISALIPADPARAEQLIGRLSDLLRSSLDNTGQPLISLKKELEIVEDYFEIEKARFGTRLRGRIEVPAELLEAKVPPLAVQSLVENAVKHGIASSPAGGEFVVNARLAEGRLHVNVSDTGPGFDSSSIHAGHGLDNLVGRLDALFGADARLSILQNGQSEVEMVLPYL
jgi:sensor histidine kinase YesM